MFGLLDTEDPRQAGQLAMAMGLLEAGAPSTKPIGLGQAVAHAYGSSQKAMQGVQDRQLEKQLAEMKMRQLQGQLADQDATLAEKKKVSDFWGGIGKYMQTPEQMALGAGAAEGDIGPTNTNAARIPSMPPASLNASALYQGMLQSGVGSLAEAGMKGLAKDKPKVDSWKQVRIGGQVLYAPYFEDGTVGKAVPYEVAEKLHTVNTGGETVSLDPFTGSRVSSIKNTQSPESVASQAMQWRLHSTPSASAMLNAQAGRIPQGYRMSSDGTKLEAIPGGPADLGKALPGPAVKELGGAGTAVENTRRLAGSFKEDFGGKTILGNLSNTYGRIFGDDTGQAQWWQDMDTLQNQTRHELFGSALTKTELAAWEKTSITPRMEPKQIQENLRRRQDIEARAASKLARAYTAAGYNKEQIRELLGNAAEYVNNPAPPVPPVGQSKGGKQQGGLGSGFTFLGFE